MFIFVMGLTFSTLLELGVLPLLAKMFKTGWETPVLEHESCTEQSSYFPAQLHFLSEMPQLAQGSSIPCLVCSQHVTSVTFLAPSAALLAISLPLCPPKLLAYSHHEPAGTEGLSTRALASPTGWIPLVGSLRSDLELHSK